MRRFRFDMKREDGAELSFRIRGVIPGLYCLEVQTSQGTSVLGEGSYVSYEDVYKRVLCFMEHVSRKWGFREE